MANGTSKAAITRGGAGQTEDAVANRQVKQLLERVWRSAVECHASESADTSFMNDADQVRVLASLDRIDQLHAWILELPQYDMVDTKDERLPLTPFPTFVPVENEIINDLVQMFADAWHQLFNSQSARMKSGLMRPDSARLADNITKARKYMTEFVGNEEVQPADYPASSPRREVSEAGMRGN